MGDDVLLGMLNAVRESYEEGPLDLEKVEVLISCGLVLARSSNHCWARQGDGELLSFFLAELGSAVADYHYFVKDLEPLSLQAPQLPREDSDPEETIPCPRVVTRTRETPSSPQVKKGPFPTRSLPTFAREVFKAVLLTALVLTVWIHLPVGLQRSLTTRSMWGGARDTLTPDTFGVNHRRSLLSRKGGNPTFTGVQMHATQETWISEYVVGLMVVETLCVFILALHPPLRPFKTRIIGGGGPILFGNLFHGEYSPLGQRLGGSSACTGAQGQATCNPHFRAVGSGEERDFSAE